MYILVSIITILASIANLALFIKFWHMTADVKELLLTVKAKEERELGLPRHAKIKSSGKEVEAIGVDNGQILCVVQAGGTEYSEGYDYSDVELL